ncbi:MAG TPA: WbuC family cupin fold metalloprotein [Thermoanaerobaculaceae bacterium]|nr:WbuC family cupin fold metalloprotein [Thermoanaerobaculaceae bacterium]HRS16691.1 WbuC family cupin fold metalloprotein [Thermoanaerobaculaceae bacterium]
MRLLSSRDLDELAAVASRTLRRRANLNLHPQLEDPVQRMLNCFQPGTYVRPHHHDPERWELFVVLRGRVGILTFDASAAVTGQVVLAPDGTVTAEIPGGVDHAVVALEPDSIVVEVKPGPFRPLTDKDFAPWSPREGEPAAAELVEGWSRRLAALCEKGGKQG